MTRLEAYCRKIEEHVMELNNRYEAEPYSDLYLQSFEMIIQMIEKAGENFLMALESTSMAVSFLENSMGTATDYGDNFMNLIANECGPHFLARYQRYQKVVVLFEKVYNEWKRTSGRTVGSLPSAKPVDSISIYERMADKQVRKVTCK